MNNVLDKKEILNQLERLDADVCRLLNGQLTNNRVIVVGTAAFMLQGLSDHCTTSDIDILEIDGAVANLFASYPSINTQCKFFSSCIPYNFEDRLHYLGINTRILDYYTLSNEDLAVMKLYRYEDADVKDLANPNFLKQLDWEKLGLLVYDGEEALASRITFPPEKDRGYQEMLYNYERYKDCYYTRLDL